MADGWTCVQCTFQNKMCLVCDMCGSRRPNNNVWKCLNCTYDNLIANEKCHVCQNPKPVQNNIEDTSLPPQPLLLTQVVASSHIPTHSNQLPPQPQLFSLATDSNQLPPQPQLSTLATDSNQSMISNNDDDTIYWICGQCTYTNNANLNGDKCDLCGGQRETMTLGGYDNNHYIYDLDQSIGNISQLTDNALFDIMEHDLPQEPNYQHFKSCLNIIIENAPSPKAAITILKSLKKITSRVSDQKPKYRTLDTRTEGVQTKLLGFEGSLEYLQLLGYSLDASQTKLQCLRHPSQQLLDEILVLIDDQLNNQRQEVRKIKRSKRSELISITPEILAEPVFIETDEKKGNQDESDQDIELKLDSGDFTLSQLVGLVTHETFYDESAMKVLLLCHRCFSSSLELIEAIRKRFFIPAPEEASTWTEAEIIVWCQTIQRPIQNQCVQILVEWITHYFYVDFYLQPEVLVDLQTFVEQVLECKYEADDGWYDSLSTYLTSAIENGQRKIQNSKLMISDDNNEEEDDMKKMDVKEVMDLVQINYGFNKRRSKLFGGKAPNTDLRIAFYKYSAQHLAEQLTLKDFNYFTHVHAREFLDKVWKGNKNKNKCRDLQKMIDRFNGIHKYIKISIITTKQLDERVLVLQHMIDLGKTLFDLRNFFSLMAVFSALDSIQISKLKYMWCRLDHTHKILLNYLSAICDANTNYNPQRKLMRKSFEIGMPVIPYVGLFLSDLTFVNQGAAKIVEGFINFKRFERFNERCKIVESFQKKSYKHEMTQLSMIIENDIQILNSKMDDASLKLLLAEALQLDEKNATNSEKQMIKKMQAKKKRKRAKFKKT